MKKLSLGLIVLALAATLISGCCALKGGKCGIMRSTCQTNQSCPMGKAACHSCGKVGCTTCPMGKAACPSCGKVGCTTCPTAKAACPSCGKVGCTTCAAKKVACPQCGKVGCTTCAITAKK